MWPTDIELSESQNDLKWLSIVELNLPIGCFRFADRFFVMFVPIFELFFRLFAQFQFLLFLFAILFLKTGLLLFAPFFDFLRLFAHWRIHYNRPKKNTIQIFRQAQFKQINKWTKLNRRKKKWTNDQSQKAKTFLAITHNSKGVSLWKLCEWIYCRRFMSWALFSWCADYIYINKWWSDTWTKWNGFYQMKKPSTFLVFGLAKIVIDIKKSAFLQWWIWLSIENLIIFFFDLISVLYHTKCHWMNFCKRKQDTAHICWSLTNNHLTFIEFVFVIIVNDTFWKKNNHFDAISKLVLKKKKELKMDFNLISKKKRKKEQFGKHIIKST